MVNFLLAHAMTVTATVVCLLAIWKGRMPERVGAIVIMCGWVFAMAGYAVAARANPSYQVAPYVGFIADGFVAAGLLLLALRYFRVWLGVAILLQATALALHAEFLSGDGSGSRLYIERMNILGMVVIATLAVATLHTWIGRNLSRDRVVVKAAPPVRAF